MFSDQFQMFIHYVYLSKSLSYNLGYLFKLLANNLYS